MEAEMITVYARIADPAGVLNLLRAAGPVEVEGEGAEWRSITLQTAAGTLSFFNDPDYYTGADWARQMNGLQGFLSRWQPSPHLRPLLRSIDFFCFAMSTGWEPDFTEADERLRVLFAVTELVDGMLFMMTEVRDAAGRVLVSTSGEYEARAVPPGLPPEARPDAKRAAQRALALAALAARGFSEQHMEGDAERAEGFRARLAAWVDEAGFAEEVEEEEADILRRPAGQLSEKEVYSATWQLEGLGELLWALGLAERMPIDAMSSTETLFPLIGFLDAEATRGFVASARLRPAAEIDAEQLRLQTLHWRLREYHQRPKAIDFVAYAPTAWWGMDVAGLPMIDNDLALEGKPIHGADERAYGITCALTQERHQAVNWLLGHCASYPSTDTPT